MRRPHAVTSKHHVRCSTVRLKRNKNDNDFRWESLKHSGIRENVHTMRRTERSSFIEMNIRKWRTMKDRWCIIYWCRLSSEVKSVTKEWTKEINMFPMKIERVRRVEIVGHCRIVDALFGLRLITSTRNVRERIPFIRCLSVSCMCVLAGVSVCMYVNLDYFLL